MGPEGRQAAVSLTFDNLAEASDIEFGRWATDRPVGSRPSALLDLPAILDVVDAKPPLSSVVDSRRDGPARIEAILRRITSDDRIWHALCSEITAGQAPTRGLPAARIVGPTGLVNP